MLIYLEDHINKIMYANGVFSFEIDDSSFDFCGLITNQHVIVGTTSGTDIVLDVINATVVGKEVFDEVTHYEIHMNVRLKLGEEEELEGVEPAICAEMMLSYLNLDCEFIELEFGDYSYVYRVLESDINWTN
ncbi:hypothetical protein [Brevibacillus laterosporus]|uniref:hypothetical protein n=1 Tax=Brevibacillus laterosporus TaxID=1465 RepID=UPI002E1EB6F3|nr:hypothetical protein [Brevibacillus laterosporus]MED1667202.1 hypothetical protein [Brevibacillus laterosporus]MED1719730.1 hypothetical protein [Brevibacillus laterosporus]